MSPKVSIIILNHNGLSFLKKCIDTVKKQTYKNIEVIVTDNASSDGSVEYIKKFSNVKIVAHKKNYGYAEANNIAVKYATGTFLFFLNNDTKLFPDCIEKLVSCYRDKSIVTARQIPFHDKSFVGSSGAGADIFGYPYVADDPRKTRVFYADGAMFFIKKKDFIDLGMFDEKLFIFQEDIDLSWRAQLAGYKIVSCWEAKLYHYGGATVKGGLKKTGKYQSSYLRRYLNEKNIIRNILKNYSFPLCLFILCLLMVIHAVEIITLLIMLKWSAAACYLKAYTWNFFHLGNTLDFRRKVQRRRIISDLELMKRMYWAYSKLTSFIKLGVPDFT